MAKVIKNIVISLLPFLVLGAITYMSLIPSNSIKTDWWFARLPHADKIVHFLFYFCFTLTTRFTLSWFDSYDWKIGIFLFFLVVVYGGIIEIIQGVYFERGADILDEVANTFGAFCALVLIPGKWLKAVFRLIS